jgi:hypothetical protein
MGLLRQSTIVQNDGKSARLAAMMHQPDRHAVQISVDGSCSGLNACFLGNFAVQRMMDDRAHRPYAFHRGSDQNCSEAIVTANHASSGRRWP